MPLNPTKQKLARGNIIRISFAFLLLLIFSTKKTVILTLLPLQFTGLMAEKIFFIFFNTVYLDSSPFSWLPSHHGIC